MPKCISQIHSRIIISKIFICCVIRRIYVNHFDLTTMCLFQQFQCGKVIPFKQEIHLPTVVDEQIRLFGQHRRMGIQHLIDFLPMLLEYETVLFPVHIFFEFGQVGEQVARILILRRRSNKGTNLLDFVQQIFTLLFRNIGAHLASSNIVLFISSCPKCQFGTLEPPC